MKWFLILLIPVALILLLAAFFALPLVFNSTY